MLERELQVRHLDGVFVRVVLEGDEHKTAVASDSLYRRHSYARTVIEIVIFLSLSRDLYGRGLFPLTPNDARRRAVAVFDEILLGSLRRERLLRQCMFRDAFNLARLWRP